MSSQLCLTLENKEKREGNWDGIAKTGKSHFAKLPAYRRESYLPANRNLAGIVETRVVEFEKVFWGNCRAIPVVPR